VQFPRRFPETTELQYTVQVSPDLVNWNTLTASQVGSEASDLPGFEEVTYQADDTVSSLPTLYLRLRVNLP